MKQPKPIKSKTYGVEGAIHIKGFRNKTEIKTATDLAKEYARGEAMILPGKFDMDEAEKVFLAGFSTAVDFLRSADARLHNITAFERSHEIWTAEGWALYLQSRIG